MAPQFMMDPHTSICSHSLSFASIVKVTRWLPELQPECVYFRRREREGQGADRPFSQGR
jgi:hypothetical protein